VKPLRKSPLRRSGPPKRKRAKPRRSSRIHDLAYLAEVRELGCLAAGLTAGLNCDGPMHAHHMGKRGLGQKASDDTAVCLCSKHHRQWHDCDGMFSGWTRDERDSFAWLSIETTRQQVAARRGL
jgi:hypothetical protein